MSNQQPRYSPEETARRGDEIYETIRSQIEGKNAGDIVAIDIETGAFAVDENSLAASKRLLAQHPNAEIWLVRVGDRALHRIGTAVGRT